MTQEHFIIELYCRVDDMLPKTERHIQAKLSLSELVTSGLLFALKVSSQRAFYRWLKQNWRDLFPSLPDRTRFFRCLKTHRQLTEKFLAEPTVFGVIVLTALNCVIRSERSISRIEIESARKVLPLGSGLSAANSACSSISSDW